METSAFAEYAEYAEYAKDAKYADWLKQSTPGSIVPLAMFFVVLIKVFTYIRSDILLVLSVLSAKEHSLKEIPFHSFH